MTPAPRPRRATRTTSVMTAAVVALVLAGCTTTQTGTPRAADQSTTRPAVRSSPSASATPSAAPTSTQPAPLTIAELKPLLLKRSELADIMGDTDMQQLQAFEQATRSNDVQITPAGCRNLALPAETAVWSDSTKALAGDANRGAGGQAVTQVVAVMASSAVAADTVNSILTAFWRMQCQPGQPFTMKLDTGEQQWVPDTPQSSGQPQRISVNFTRADPPRYCTHAYTSANNVLIEALACGKADTATQAAAVLDRIKAKIG